MDLKNLTVFGMVNKNMRYLTAKEQVLATNIANATTPGYLPQDVEKPSFVEDLAQTKHRANLTVTHNKHYTQLLSESRQKTQNGFVVYTPQPKDALTIDGNGVILEDQMNEASKASAEYKKMITIYNSYKNMLSVANTRING